MHTTNKLSILKLRLVLILVWVTLIPLETEALAAGPQYRQSDMEFVSRLAARLDAAESSIAVLEARLDESSSKQMSPNVLAAQSKDRKPIHAGAAKPRKVDGAYTRVPERLRHKQRAVDTQPDNLGRIKVRFPLLREDISKARKDLLGHELTHLSQSRTSKPLPPELVKAERSVADIERNLTNLSSEVQAVEKAQTIKTISR